MKKILALMILSLAAFAAGAEPIASRPLVREGVSWVYFHKYMNYGREGRPIATVVYRYTFGGDTVVAVGGEEVTYRKLFRSAEFGSNADINPADYSEAEPCALVCERLGAVHARLTGAYADLEDDGTLGRLLYDFGGDNAMVWSTGGKVVDLPCVGTATIAGTPVRTFAKTASTDAPVSVVESVGYIGINGDLLFPNPEEKIRLTMSSRGFCCLEDAEGNVLLKGRHYGIYRPSAESADINGDRHVDVSDLNIVIDSAVGVAVTPFADINCDGCVDIADINAVVNSMLGR